MLLRTIKCLTLGALFAHSGCIRDPGSPMEYRLPNREPVELWSIKDSIPLKDIPNRSNFIEGPMEFLGIPGKGSAYYIKDKPDRINWFMWAADFADTAHFVRACDTILRYFRGRYGPEQSRSVDGDESDSSGYTLFWTLPFDSVHTYDMVVSLSVYPFLAEDQVLKNASGSQLKAYVFGIAATTWMQREAGHSSKQNIERWRHLTRKRPKASGRKHSESH